MASSKQTSIMIDELIEELQCAICDDLLHQPKCLQCIHTFCRDCLYELAKVPNGRDQQILACPLCREETPVPPSGIAGLKSNFLAINLLEKISRHPYQDDPKKECCDSVCPKEVKDAEKAQANGVQTYAMATSQSVQGVQGSKPVMISKEQRQRNRIQGGWSNSRPPSSRRGRGQGSVGQGTRGRGVGGRGGNISHQNVTHPNACTPWQENQPLNGTQQSSYGNGLGQPEDAGHGFRFEASEGMNRREEVVEKEIHEDGMQKLSGGPTGESVIQLCRHFLLEDEAQDIFIQLLQVLKWTRRKKRGGEEYHEPRWTCWFGEFPYEFSRDGMQSSKEWHPLVRQMKDRIELNTGYKFNSVLCNLYKDGHDGVQWHSDDAFSLGQHPVLASLSFGATRRFQMRKKLSPDASAENPDDYSQSEKYVLNLNSGSLLVMMGCTQDDWQHRVPKEYHDRGARVNLTFRTIHHDGAHRPQPTYPQEQ